MDGRIDSLDYNSMLYSLCRHQRRLEDNFISFTYFISIKYNFYYANVFSKNVIFSVRTALKIGLKFIATRNYIVRKLACRRATRSTATTTAEETYGNVP